MKSCINIFIYLANIRTKGGVPKIMLEQIMNSPTMDYLGRGLQAATMRHEVISNNIANVNTPNFKKSEVVFESLLAKELGLDSKGKLAMVRTNDKHLPMAPEGGATAQIHQVTTTSMRTDNNNVDIDVEMASMAKNQLYYNAMARNIGGYITKMKDVLTSK